MKLVIFIALALGFYFSAHAQDENDSPLSWKEHLDAGLSAYDKENYPDALVSFEKAELEAETPGLVQFNIGLCHYHLLEDDLAAASFEKVLNDKDAVIAMKAMYNLGHLKYRQSLKVSTNSGGYEIEHEHIKSSLDYFRDVIRQEDRPHVRNSNEAMQIVENAKFNQRLIVARLKDLEDKKNQKKGNKVNLLQGTVKVNGRPVAGAQVYAKSKWEDEITGQSRSAEGGAYVLDALEMGKYQLAASLYEVQDPQKLHWSEPHKVPSYEKDAKDLPIGGVLSLACPYQASHPALPAPYDDYVRLGGSASITKSTDWGLLTDGRPIESFPEDNDIDTGYVAFGQDQFQIAMGLPPAQQMPKTTEPQESPKYRITLKGYHDQKVAVLPRAFNVMGIQKDQKDPILLYQGIVKTTEMGRYSWQTDEFEQKDCRQLIFAFHRQGGKRVSLHEIEVHEKTPQQKQKQDPKDDKQQQDQDQKQDQQQQQPKQEKQEEKKASKPVQSILRNIRKKQKDNEKSKQVRGMILRSERDW